MENLSWEILWPYCIIYSQKLADKIRKTWFRVSLLSSKTYIFRYIVKSIIFCDKTILKQESWKQRKRNCNYENFSFIKNFSFWMKDCSTWLMKVFFTTVLYVFVTDIFTCLMPTVQSQNLTAYLNRTLGFVNETKTSVNCQKLREKGLASIAFTKISIISFIRRELSLKFSS